MRVIKRIVKVAIPTIKEAIQSKEHFEALAFCLFVKLNITSSAIHKATYRRLKQLTRLGNQKLKRIIDYCVEHGMIVREDSNTLLFKPLYNNEYYVYVYKFRNYYKRRKKKCNELVFNLSLIQVKDMLRNAAICGHLKRIQGLRQTLLLTENPKTVNDYRKGKKLARRLAVWGNEFFISNKRLSQIAGCCISKVQELKNGLLKHCVVIRDFCNTLICCGEDPCGKFTARYKELIEDSSEFLFLGDGGKVYKHNPNRYTYVGKQIAYVLKNNK